MHRTQQHTSSLHDWVEVASLMKDDGLPRCWPGIVAFNEDRASRDTSKLNEAVAALPNIVPLSGACRSGGRD